jgi:toxin ParE1/3/4
MMRIRWTQAAAADLQHISDYLKDHHPQYSEPSLRRVYSSIQSRKEWPYRRRAGREEGTREILFLPLPYVAVYRVKEQSIEILRLYHGAQDRPAGGDR